MQETVTQDRERFIGGSDIPSIMGISPFTTRYELLKYKAEIEGNDFEGSIYTEYGNMMESKIRDYINTLGYDFIEDKIILDDSDVLPTRYHGDGLDHDQCVVLEVKTTGQKHDTLDGYKKYLVQLLYGMWAFGYDEGVLAVYERPSDFDTDFDKDRLQVFFIGMEDYETLMNEILTEVKKFREDFVYLRERPFAEESELPSRNQLVPIADKLMTLEADIKWAKDVVTQYDELKKQLCEKMQEYSVKSWTMPNGTKVTLVPKGEDKTVKKFDEKAFKKEHENLYMKYEKDKVQKGRSAYVRITPVVKGEDA